MATDTRIYTAVVESDSATGLFVGYIPGLPGAHTQAATLEELSANLREVMDLLLTDANRRFAPGAAAEPQNR